MTSAPEFSVKLADEAATIAFAVAVADCVSARECVTLSGDLGAGKTTFARAFIRALAGDVEVLSPTFTLAQDYQTQAGRITHMDLYRIRHADELEEIGFSEALEQGMCIIEWPEVAAHALPGERLDLHFFTQGDSRIAVGKASAQCYAQLQKRGIIT